MSVKTMLTNFGLAATKNAPTAMVIGGVITGIIAAVIAVKEAPKVHDVIVKDKETVKRIKEMEEEPSAMVPIEQGDVDDEPVYVPYDHELAEKDRKECAKHTICYAIKSYALPVGLGLLSMFLIFKGYKMKCNALASLTVAYNSTVAGFKTYRKRVVDRFGEDIDRELILGKSTVVLENEDEEGNLTVEEKETINPVNDECVLVFDSSCPEHRNDPKFIREFFNIVERNAHIIYNNRNTKHLYLHELTDALGIERDLSKGAQGWCEKLDPDDIGLKLSLANAYINNEDGQYVAYIPLMLDGIIR